MIIVEEEKTFEKGTFENVGDNKDKKQGRSDISQKHPGKKKIWVVVGSLLAAALFCYGAYKAWLGRIEDIYLAAEQKAYDDIYQTAFDRAEAWYHVSNHVLLSVEGVREVSRLEVLTVNGSEFVIKNADEDDPTTSWLEVKGVGVFTVDLSSGEFIVDNERHYILVRVPKPMLTECKIEGTGKQFFDDGRFFSNGSVDEGVRLSQAQLSEGRMKLEDSMKKSRVFYDASMEAAVRSIDLLVHEWNPDVQDLHVEVEFIEDV